MATIDLRDVRKGDWFLTPRMKQMGWPYVQATGDAIHDPDHPSDTTSEYDELEDYFEPVDMWIVPYGRGFTPHEIGDDQIDVIRPAAEQPDEIDHYIC